MKYWNLFSVFAVGASFLALVSFQSATPEPPVDKGVMKRLEWLEERVVWLKQHRVEPGTIVAFGGEVKNVPEGWILCDGRALDKDGENGKYDRLYKAIEDSWGNGKMGLGVLQGVTNFNVPDLRGVFLRGVNGSFKGTGVDPEASTRMARFGGNDKNKVGSYQSYAIQKHSHEFRWGQAPSSSNKEAISGGSIMDYNNYGKSIIFKNVIKETGGSETRPKNVYVNYIIKF